MFQTLKHEDTSFHHTAGRDVFAGVVPGETTIRDGSERADCLEPGLELGDDGGGWDICGGKRVGAVKAGDRRGVVAAGIADGNPVAGGIVDLPEPLGAGTGAGGSGRGLGRGRFSATERGEEGMKRGT